MIFFVGAAIKRLVGRKVGAQWNQPGFFKVGKLRTYRIGDLIMIVARATLDVDFHTWLCDVSLHQIHYIVR